MVSVLGKRARASDFNSSQESLSTSARVKRGANRQVANNEDVFLNDPHSYGVNTHHHTNLLSSKTGRSKRSKLSKAQLGVRAGCTSIRAPVSSPLKDGPRLSLAEPAEEKENALQLPTPTTPRHRDALFKKVQITPRHRSIIGNPLTPRTPQIPRTPTKASTVYNCARQLFARNLDPGRLTGRDQEREELSQFLESGVSSRRGRCLYISGPPGTGKSALIGEVCNELPTGNNVKSTFVNCMSVRRPEDIYSKLVTDFSEDGALQSVNCSELASSLQSMFLRKKISTGHTYMVTLDEIDHLLSLDLEILYQLFEWSLHKDSRLIMIGISNALDLTTRFLPRLRARNLKPQLLPFMPYTAKQIESIITSKLRSLLSEDSNAETSFVPFVHPAAVQLCSKKVASQTGDLRKAFDIIRRTIDAVEADTRAKQEAQPSPRALQISPTKSPLADNPNLASPSSQSAHSPTKALAGLNPLTAPRATIAHVSKVSAAILSNGTTQRLHTLNIQQKAALCALISHEKSCDARASSVFATPSKSQSTAPTVKKLHEGYCSLCSRETSLHALTLSEFADVISGLESSGLVSEEWGRGYAKPATPSKRSRGEDRRISSLVDAEEMQGCLQGIQGSLLGVMLESNV